MTQAAVHTPTLRIDALPWLIANTIRIHGNRCLVVHRSTELSEDDDLYKPVLEFLAANQYSIQCGPDVGFDADIEGELGVVTTYRLAVP